MRRAPREGSRSALVTTGRRARQARGGARVPVRGGGPDRRHPPKRRTASASQADRGHDVHRALAPVRAAAPAVSLAVVGFRAKGSCGPAQHGSTRESHAHFEVTSAAQLADVDPTVRRARPSATTALCQATLPLPFGAVFCVWLATAHSHTRCSALRRNTRFNQLRHRLWQGCTDRTTLLQRTLLQTLIMRERRNLRRPFARDLLSRPNTLSEKR